MGKHPRAWKPRKRVLAGVTPEGDPIWETVPRARGRGAIINPQIRLPKSPGEWVDEQRCSVCGSTYDSYRSGVSFSEGAQRLRFAARAQGAEGGGWRSPGPVLWAMRVIKMERWFLEHFPCGAIWSQRADYQKALRQWQREHPGWQDPDVHFDEDPPYWFDPQSEVPF